MRLSSRLSWASRRTLAPSAPAAARRTSQRCRQNLTRTCSRGSAPPSTSAAPPAAAQGSCAVHAQCRRGISTGLRGACVCPRWMPLLVPVAASSHDRRLREPCSRSRGMARALVTRYAAYRAYAAILAKASRGVLTYFVFVPRFCSVSVAGLFARNCWSPSLERGTHKRWPTDTLAIATAAPNPGTPHATHDPHRQPVMISDAPSRVCVRVFALGHHPLDVHSGM